MRIRAVSTVCFLIGLIMMFGYPWILSIKPPALSAHPTLIEHRRVLAYSGLMLSYSAANLLYFLSSAIFAVWVIVEMREDYQVARQANYQQLVEAAQAELQKASNSKAES